MRILMGLHGLPPESLGGTEQTALLLARALARTEQVVLFAPLRTPSLPVGSERHWQEDSPLGGRLTGVVRKLPPAMSFAETWALPAAEAWFESLLDAHQPDVVHLHHMSGLSFRLPEQARARGIPTVLTLHDYHLLCARGQLLTLMLKPCEGPSVEGCAVCLSDQLVLETHPRLPVRAVARRLLRTLPPPWAERLQRWGEQRLTRQPSVSPHQAAAIVGRMEAGQRALDAATLLACPSEDLRQRMIRRGLSPERLLTVPQGLEPRAPTPPTLTDPDLRPLRVAFVGALIPSKGPDLLLKAVEGLPQGAVTLTLVGPAPLFHRRPEYPQQLERLARAVGARLEPPLMPEQVPAFLRTQHVLVLPSIWPENAPVSLREALLEGVPVLASGVGGISELVENGRNGLLFPPGDEAALRACLLRLLNEPFLLEQLRAGAWQTDLIELKSYTHVVIQIYSQARNIMTRSRSTAMPV